MPDKSGPRQATQRHPATRRPIRTGRPRSAMPVPRASAGRGRPIVRERVAATVEYPVAGAQPSFDPLTLECLVMIAVAAWSPERE